MANNMVAEGIIESKSEVKASTGLIYQKVKVGGRTFNDFKSEIAGYHVNEAVGEWIKFEYLEKANKNEGQPPYKNIVKVLASKPAIESPKVQPAQKEIREELRDEESSIGDVGEIGGLAGIGEIITRTQNIEKYLVENNKITADFLKDMSDRMGRLESLFAKDYDSNWEMVKNIIQTQARIEEMIKLIAKKIGIEESAEFVKASLI